ncbi:hypothetical protein ARMA_0588 [Ardenticatena maritima]|uniref:DegV family protein n=1 Tax=Ardenticatena maritima TaxID=872965 RepID=A0A0M8K5K8_9CHLR|nr:DegV family protein [Ardenticatena maritima]KPL86324.1 hypothetical protein SE16_13420 [Ardenticatena maritima]GAP62165.1 hypothetical protein ARMA_0588 [Ardenticatena maritima]
MSKIAIITDSTADLTPAEQAEFGIHVVPLNIHIGDKVYQDGVDLDRESFFHMLRDPSMPTPYTSPPTVQQFVDVYTQAVDALTDDPNEVVDIISLHISREMSKTIEVAQQAALQMVGRANVHIVDSRLTSVGLGLLAKEAAKAIQAGYSIEEAVRMLRGLVNHVYIVFFVETLDFLQRGGQIGPAQVLLGTMLNIKPILMIEEGQIEPLEKVRTREKAIEKLAEFVAEFGYIEHITILHHHGDPNEIEHLITLIRNQRPDVSLDVREYGPVLAVHVGPDALGVMVSEGLTDNPWDV